MKKPLFLLLALNLIIFALGCEKKNSIITSGSTTVLPVVSKAADRFKSKYGINIIVNAGGSGVGINQLGEGKTHIGMASRDITTSEIQKYPNVQFITHSIGRDAVVPVVSSEIYDLGIQALSLEDIAKIYQGKIKNWKELSGPDREILVIDKETSRGTRHVFMNAILGDKKAKALGADLVIGSNNEEQTAIMQSDSAIGMLSHAWLNQDVKGLSIRMSNKTVVTPTLKNIINGSFPITRDLVLITNGTPKGKVKGFIDFILSKEGQTIVEEAGYVRIQQ